MKRAAHHTILQHIRLHITTISRHQAAFITISIIWLLRNAIFYFPFYTNYEFPTLYQPQIAQHNFQTIFGSDNFIWNFALIFTGIAYLISHRKYIWALTAASFSLILLFYTNDTTRYSFTIYSLLFVLTCIISAKYFWVTITAPGYHDPYYTRIQELSHAK